MDQKTFIKKLAIWTAIVGAVILAIIGLCAGKIIEGSVTAEVTKWVVVGAAVIGILEGFIAMGVGGVIYHFLVERKNENKE